MNASFHRRVQLRLLHILPRGPAFHQSLNRRFARFRPLVPSFSSLSSPFSSSSSSSSSSSPAAGAAQEAETGEEGTLLHRTTSSKTGDIHVFEHAVEGIKLRELQFGNMKDKITQTLQDVNQPHRPLLPYFSHMMSLLALFPPTVIPNRILLLGLGGGSFYHYLRHYYPKARIEVVELDLAVVETARDYFAFPEEGVDALLTTHVADGFDFVSALSASNAKDKPAYDLIIQDAVCAPPHQLLTDTAFGYFDRLLTERGVFIQNFFIRDVKPTSAIQAARRVFRNGLYLLVTDDNIVFAAPSSLNMSQEELPGWVVPGTSAANPQPLGLLADEVAEDMDVEAEENKQPAVKALFEKTQNKLFTRTHPISEETLVDRGVWALDNDHIDLELIANLQDVSYVAPLPSH